MKVTTQECGSVKDILLEFGYVVWGKTPCRSVCERYKFCERFVKGATLVSRWVKNAMLEFVRVKDITLESGCTYDRHNIGFWVCECHNIGH